MFYLTVMTTLTSADLAMFDALGADSTNHNFDPNLQFILLEQALQAGANPNIAYLESEFYSNVLRQNHYPLDMAVMLRQPAMIDLLLDYGASFVVPQSHHRSALSYALLEKFKAQKIKHHRSALCYALDHEFWPEAETLIHRGALKAYPEGHPQGDPYQIPPLHKCARSTNNAFLELLLSLGLNPNVRDFEDWTPLMYAAHNSRQCALETLIHYGADIHLVNHEKKTALHLAAVYPVLEPFLFLLKHGANPFAVDNKGATPLDLCPTDTKPSIEAFLESMALQHELNALLPQASKNSQGARL